MKKLLLLFVFSFLAVNSATIQAQTLRNEPGSSGSVKTTQSLTTRTRSIADLPVNNHAQKPGSDVIRTSQSSPEWGNTAVPGSRPQDSSSAQIGNSQTRVTSPAALVSAGRALVREDSAGAAALNSIYRVGVGDVLDIRLMNLPSRESTLFTVLKGGTVEYPLLTEAIRVEGLSTQQIAVALATQIKVINSPQVTVTVRDYASHAVTITGAVENPGRKILRREAMPLYAILAEAQPRADAATITIARVNGMTETVAMADPKAMSTLVFSGDSIKASGNKSIAKRFVYVGGDVSSAGEKEFRDGMTLTQLLLAAGGPSRGSNNTATVARLNSKGFLNSTQYDLVSIQEGKLQDPLLEPGDRVQITSRPQ